MSSAYFCDICNKIISRGGSNRSGFIGVGDSVIDACMECQTSVGVFLAGRQAEMREDSITLTSEPNIDFVAALKAKEELDASVEVSN